MLGDYREVIMKHILLLLYFLSYTSGIGAITLGAFYYIKNKSLSLKYIVLADLFFTVFLFFDNLNFYTDVFINGFLTWLQIIKIAGLTISSIGIIYFFTLAAYIEIGIEFTKHKKAFYFISAITFFTLCAGTSYTLYNLNLISKTAAIHSCFFLPNIFTSIWIVYNIILIVTNRSNINKIIKQFVITIVILAAIITPLSLLTNLIQYWHFTTIPIAYSPIEYFSFNLVALILARRHLKKVNSIEIESTIPSSHECFEELCNKYHLTQREVEIIKLIRDGLSNQEIAENLFISSNTARNHIYNIYKKVGTKNRYELINLFSNQNNNINN